MNLSLNTNQINQILNALAKQPYAQVHELIHTITSQAQSQLDEQQTAEVSTDGQTASE